MAGAVGNEAGVWGTAQVILDLTAMGRTEIEESEITKGGHE